MTAGNHSLERMGNLALVGAGKMGGAMLQGWLALGLPPKNVAIFDPHPSSEIAALGAKGIAINPAKARQAVGRSCSRSSRRSRPR